MQSLSWYWHRLRSMPPAEVSWRVGALMQEWVDRCALTARTRSLPLKSITQPGADVLAWRTGVYADYIPEACDPDISRLLGAERCAKLRAQADAVCANRLSFFDLDDCDLGSEVNWNYEYAARRPTPMGFAPKVDYRDYREVGDAKVVWEPNRHQQLAILGRAYRLTGEQRYAEKVIELIESWIDQCPYGRGMNWRSPLELAIRLINWVWAFELIAPAGVLTEERRRRLAPAIYRHLWEIARKYSRHSSANNHVIGEAAGVFIGSSYFIGLKQAKKWRAESWDLLLRESERQTTVDGVNRELAPGYHLFVLEFLLHAGLVARRTGHDFPTAYWDRLESMVEFVAELSAGGGSMPMFGDCDDGYVVDLGGRARPVQALLALGANLCGREDFAELADSNDEPVLWLMGKDALEQSESSHERCASSAGANRGVLKSQAWPEAGYYLLQSGGRNPAEEGGDERISVTFDCGELGFGSIAAHGHADALSFTLRAFGSDILVDPGTYDYFTAPKWRQYFRGTRAHNTIMVDGLEQSEMLGLFLWGARAQARCVSWEPSETGGTVTGEHDGYTRGADPVLHRRTLHLDGAARVLTVRDELTARAQHEAEFMLHFAEPCRVRPQETGVYRVSCPGGALTLRVDPKLAVSLAHGSERPILGWVSRGYHRKQPAPTLSGKCQWSGTLILETRLELEHPRSKTAAGQQIEQESVGVKGPC